jgi:beta-lactamase regulating signal transducer with metallopeptidase domain
MGDIMSAAFDGATLLEATAQVATFGLNWLVQSSLLLALGLLIGWHVRHLGSAIQSAVYRTTLVAVLACPLIAWALAAGGVPGLMIDSEWIWGAQEVAEAGLPVTEAPVAETDALTATIASAKPRPTSAAAPISPDVTPVVSPTESPTNTATSTGATASHASPGLAAPSFGWILGALATAWCVVAAALLLRLGGAWRQLVRIRQGAAEADATTRATCREVASLMQLATPHVMHSPYLPSPCLVGWQRPAVLLPEAFQAMSLRDVLIHELAHIRRRDCQWSLLARLATAVFFFQPLLWKLSRRLDATAEEVCDDYVMQYGNDRREYAHRLVDIAELANTPVAAAAVGMVSLKSMLARRVARIADTSRRLSTRVGTVTRMTLLAVGLICTASAGLVGFRASTSAQDVVAEDHVPQAGAGLLTVRGQVVDSDGKPVADAQVAAIGVSLRAERGGDLPSRDEVLAETTTNEEGRFVITTVDPVSSSTHMYSRMIARSEGLGLGWQNLNLDVTDTDVMIELLAEQVIRGRLVDPLGEPAARVRLLVEAVVPRTEIDERLSCMGSYHFDNPPAAWPPQVVSDDQGRFAVRGIPGGYGVFLDLADNDRYVTEGLSLNTGEPEQRPEHDGTYRAQVKNAAPGEEITLTLAPARFFEGTVRYEDTGQPAPHARLTIWASQEEKFGSMVSVPGTADANGKYRICPMPGVRFGINAYPANGEPYLIRKTRDLRWDVDGNTKQVDVTLRRGVLVRGKVAESDNDTPIAGASVQYVPEAENNPHDADDIVTGWQGIQVTDEQGEFEIAVLPGPGRLIAHGPANDYVLQESSSYELNRGTQGGARVYAHAIRKLDLAEKTEPLDVMLALERSPMITGELIDEQGAPVAEGLLISRLAIRPGWLRWQFVPQTVMGGEFQVGGLASGEECPLYFLAPNRQLAATVVAKAGAEPVRIALKPCGKAAMRFVDHDGTPIADHHPTVEMIFTPGPNRYVRGPSAPGALDANSSFISNIDRLNHWTRRKTDADGRITVPALIPGATYTVAVTCDGKPAIAKTFEVTTNETLDLGDIVIDRPE